MDNATCHRTHVVQKKDEHGVQLFLETDEANTAITKAFGGRDDRDAVFKPRTSANLLHDTG